MLQCWIRASSEKRLGKLVERVIWHPPAACNSVTPIDIVWTHTGNGSGPVPDPFQYTRNTRTIQPRKNARGIPVPTKTVISRDSKHHLKSGPDHSSNPNRLFIHFFVLRCSPETISDRGFPFPEGKSETVPIMKTAFMLLRATLLAAALLLAAVAPAAAAGGPTICPAVYFGVCCKIRSGYRTLYKEVGNDCNCNQQYHGTVVNESYCQPRYTTAPPTKKPPCICPYIFKPVCCTKNGVTTQAPNSCLCDCVGGKVIYPPGGCGTQTPIR
jgi:hypothetical protein